MASNVCLQPSLQAQRPAGQSKVQAGRKGVNLPFRGAAFLVWGLWRALQDSSLAGYRQKVALGLLPQARVGVEIWTAVLVVEAIPL